MNRAGACLLLLAIGLGVFTSSPSPAAPNAERENGLTITVDTSKEGTIKASGRFTATKDVTLMKVEVRAYPTRGGVVPPPAEVAKLGIDDKKKTWGEATITTRVYDGGYTVRADGYFSDGTSVSSGYLVQTVGGDDAPAPGLTLEWVAGFPTSKAPKLLSACGTYKGKPNANGTGQLVAIPLGGGPRTTTVLTLNKETNGWCDAPAVKVPTGGRVYTVIGVANDGGPNGGLTYCTPYCQTYVTP
jgi:hypothetical protein